MTALTISTRATPFVEVGRRGAGRVSRTLHAPCTLHVGSSSACDLRVVARGVRARHLALEWDGRRLILVSEPGAGPVHADGHLVRPPFVVSGSMTLDIGEAEVRVSVPEPLEDEPTLVMDRDRTEVPPPRNDDPTEVSLRSPLPADATTTQRVRHHRSRLDAICGPVDRAEGRVRRAAEAALGPLSRRRVAAVGLALSIVIGGAVAALSRSHRRPVAPVFVRPSAASAPSSAPASLRGPVGLPGTGFAAIRTAGSAQNGTTPSTAARLLVSGRRHEASAAYAALSRTRPQESVFGVVARILAREEHPDDITPEASP